MSTVAEVLDALASTIAQGTGLRADSYVRENLEPPACFVTVDQIELGAMQLGQMDIHARVVVFTSTASDRAGQLAVYDYMTFTGEKSIWAAVNNYPTLGLGDTNAAVTLLRQLTVEEVAAYGYYGALFDVLILTAGA